MKLTFDTVNTKKILSHALKQTYTIILTNVTIRKNFFSSECILMLAIVNFYAIFIITFLLEKIAVVHSRKNVKLQRRYTA